MQNLKYRLKSIKHIILLLTITLSFIATAFAQVVAQANGTVTQEVNAIGDDYENALSAYKKGDYAASVIYLKGNLQSNASHISSRVLLAENYIALNNGLSAVEELLTAQKAGAGNSRIMPLLAQAYLLQSKYDAVLDFLPSSQGDIVFRSDILSYRGLAYLGKKNTILAKSAFNEALSLLPVNINALLGLAKLHLSLKQPEDAITYIEKTLAIAPTKKHALLMAAITYQSLNKVTEALAAANQLISLEPDNYNAHLVRASLYSVLGDHQAALADLDVVTEKMPNEPISNYFKMLSLSAINSDEIAEQTRSHLMTVVGGISDEMMTAQPIYYFLSGLVAFQSKAYRKAENYLLKYHALLPNDLKAIKLIARTEMALTDYNQAKKYLMKGHLLDQSEQEIWSLLGRVSMLLGDLDKAQYYFQQVLDAQPDSLTAKYDFTKLLLLMGKHHTIIKLFEKSISTPELMINLSEEMRFILAKSLQEVSDYQRAINVVNSIITQSPNNSYAHQLMGSLLGLSGDIKAAYQAYLKAVELDVNNFQAVIHLARLERALGDSQASITRLSTALTEHGNSALFIELGDAYQAINDNNNAQIYYQKALAYNPSSVLSLQKIVEQHISKNELNEAVYVVENYLNKYPDNVEAQQLAGELYFKNNQHSKALGAFENAIKHSNNKGESLLKLAKIQIQLSQRSNAVNSLQRAIAWEESYLPAYLLLINLYTEEAKKEQTMILIDKVSKLTDDLALIAQLKGDLFWRLGDEKLATKNFQQSISIKINQPALLGLFRVYRKSKQFNKITVLLQDWLKQQPNDLVAAISLAENYRQSGDKKQAFAYYQKLQQQFPNNPALLNNTAIVAIELKQLADASVLIEQAFKLAPKNINVMDTKAWLATQLGNYEESLALLREANTLNYANAEIKYHLAVTLDKMGRRGEALAYLESALNSQQHFDDITQAQLLLAQWSQ